jgi:lipoyl-dependent peroxiredoxin
MTFASASPAEPFIPFLNFSQPTERTNMTQLEKVLYTAKAHTTGGRDGQSRTDDGRLDIKLTPPGTGGAGTNPEQLFAAGYSACFIGAMKAVAGKMKVTLPAELAIDAEVDLGPIPGAYGIAARLNVSLPGMDRAAAQALLDAAHKVCPYSNATRGNIDVKINLV